MGKGDRVSKLEKEEKAKRKVGNGKNQEGSLIVPLQTIRAG